MQSGTVTLSDRAGIPAAQAPVLDAARRREYPEASQFAVRLAIEEALANAIKHGHRDDPSKVVRMDWSVDEKRIRLSVQDEGPGFDPDSLPDPTAPEFIERPHGRGVMLMRAYMTTVQYEDGGRRLLMVYTRPQDADDGSS